MMFKGKKFKFFLILHFTHKPTVHLKNFMGYHYALLLFYDLKDSDILSLSYEVHFGSNCNGWCDPTLMNTDLGFHL